MTWEYSKEIKKDYVDATEDFWQQHSPSATEEVKSISEWPHPHVRDFKMLSVSPLFGVSKVKQPVDDIGKHLSAEVMEASYQSNNGDNDNEMPAIQLCGDQIEGVNWLLRNWWNDLSCILADDMGLGWVSIFHFCYFYHELDYNNVSVNAWLV